jgi:hypothetical protein
MKITSLGENLTVPRRVTNLWLPGITGTILLKDNGGYHERE